MVTRLMCVLVFFHSAVTVLLVISRHSVAGDACQVYGDTTEEFHRVHLGFMCRQSTELGHRVQ